MIAMQICSGTYNLHLHDNRSPSPSISQRRSKIILPLPDDDANSANITTMSDSPSHCYCSCYAINALVYELMCVSVPNTASSPPQGGVAWMSSSMGTRSVSIPTW
mmetsp:Transcript_19391/g.42109  ORF Transcript_19391/g.42109 Transcript_19391/m.42109 type:complete len:105 (-) Transcript_19391:1437-1751(-)